MRLLFHGLNYFFHFLHLSMMSFVLTGWMFPSLRFIHYLLLILILASWLGLGIKYGFGYCLITDVHWKVKEKLDQRPHTEYYVKYVCDKITGWNFNPRVIDGITTYSFFLVLAISTFLMVNRYIM